MWPFLPFDHSAILSAIPPFHPPFRHSAIPPFRHSAISTIPTYKLPTYIQTYEMGPERLGEAFLQRNKLLDTYTKCLNAGLFAAIPHHPTKYD